jgi:hypothetical protein
MTFDIIFSFFAGAWFGLLPYMLLRYQNCDLFGSGRYLEGRTNDESEDSEQA